MSFDGVQNNVSWDGVLPAEAPFQCLFSFWVFVDALSGNRQRVVDKGYLTSEVFINLFDVGLL